MKQMIKLAAAAAMSAALAGSALAGSCIVSGYPAENPKSTLASSATTLEVATVRGKSDVSSLEARYRTLLNAIMSGTYLNSFKSSGFSLFVR